MESDVFSYEITREETRSRNAGYIQLLRIVLPSGLLFGLICAIATQRYDKNLPGMYDALIIFLLAWLARAALINRYFPYAERSYRMDGQGITISKGKKIKNYRWEEFVDYFVPGDRVPIQDGGVSAGNEGGSGEVPAPNYPKNYAPSLDFRTTFYLNPKVYGLRKLMRNYVVVYGEADNSRKVNDFLSSYLPRRKMEARDEAGLMHYEFK